MLIPLMIDATLVAIATVYLAILWYSGTEGQS